MENKSDDDVNKTVDVTNNVDNVELPSENVVNEIIEKLPEKDKKIIQAVMMESRFSGPIPPPELLSGYKSILPDAPERILHMAEEEQAHRHRLETCLITRNFKQTSVGQILGFSISIMFGVFSLILGLHGHDWLAGVLGTTTVVSLAVIFVLNQKPSNNDMRIQGSNHPQSASLPETTQTNNN